MSGLEQLKQGLRQAHLTGLDGVRGAAAIWVVFAHAGLPFASGALAVLVFFVLSGFLITWLLLSEEEKRGGISLRAFYARRSLRIFPAFYVYWLLYTIGKALFNKGNCVTIQSVSSLFYMNNYYQAIWGDPGTTLSHTWSLAIEEQFYLFWPCTFVLLKRNSTRLKFLLAAVGVLWIYREVMFLVLRVPQRYVYQALDMRADHLLIGCLLAVAVHQGSFARLWSFICRSPLMQVATLTLLVAEEFVAFSGLHAAHFGEADRRFRFWGGFVLEPVLIMMLLPQLIAFKNGPITWLLETRPMRYLGRISYSVYLYQQIVTSAVARELADMPRGLVIAVSVGVAILLGTASYFLVELPFLRLKDRFHREKSLELAPSNASVQSSDVLSV